MKLKKYLASFVIGTTVLLSSSGCSLPFLANNSSEESTEISHKPYSNKAVSTEEIVKFIGDSLYTGTNRCEIFVPNEELIDANLWLEYLNGVEQIQCEYKKVKDGYNMVVTYENWDNYSIVKAYRSKDTSNLNKRQLELYNKYIEILNTYTSPTNSDFENELIIHDYLVNNIVYKESDDTSFNSYKALITGEGVCSGYTECFKTFMDMLGIENYTLSGDAGNQRHIWNVVKLDGEWYQVDVTWDDPVGNTSNFVNHNYFNITDEDMAIDHEWNHSFNSDKKAVGTKYSYINAMDIKECNSQAELDYYILQCIRRRDDYAEFYTTFTPDIKAAVSAGGVGLTYSYKSTNRKDYTLYQISFNY